MPTPTFPEIIIIAVAELLTMDAVFVVALSVIFKDPLLKLSVDDDEGTLKGTDGGVKLVVYLALLLNLIPCIFTFAN